jgi:hypothetical protein
VALAVLWAPLAHAEEGGQRAAAEVFFEQGKALVARGHFAEACTKFAESQHLDPGIGTMLWLADCLENDGQTASAWAEFKEAAALAARKHDDRVDVAHERAQALEPKLSHLTIEVPQETVIPGLVVQRDAVDVGDAEWRIAVPMDPGLHIVSASAPGRKGWSTSVDLPANGAAAKVIVPPLVPLPSEGSRPGGAQRFVGIAVGATGVVALGVATVLSFDAKSTYDASNSGGHCLPNNECDSTGTTDRNDASSLATAATVLFAVGAGAVASGAIVYFTAPKGMTRTVAVTPALARGGGSLLMVGTF